jgi:hypothetical protein
MARSPASQESSTSKRYLVRIRTANGEYDGVFYSPFPTKRLADVLVQMEGFINLKDAMDISTKEKYPFMVIGKNHIESIKVLDER